MAEKRAQEEVNEEVSYKRPCVDNTLSSDSGVAENYNHDNQAVSVLPGPASWESQASSSDSSASGSSSSGVSRPPPDNADSSSEGSVSDSLDMGLGDIQPDNIPGPMGWLQKQMMLGMNPRSILMRMIPSSLSIPDEMDEFEMWSIIAEYLRSIDEPPPRVKLEQYNTFEDTIRLLHTCKNILVLTGAGVSVSCGIPDFRSRDGVYARLAVDFPDLPDPQAMFEISYFRRNPKPFFKFAKEMFPGQFKPSTSHKFISELEQHGRLLRNYTQNIDTLEQAAGISKVIQCHGSFATASCTRCKKEVDSDFIRQDIFNQIVPICPVCGPATEEMAVLKPDIVFFGEGLPNHFYDHLDSDKEDADLLIVMGSSLKVRPVATIPNMLQKNVPQILINREPLPHLNFDIELLGDCDVIINEILHRLGGGWDNACQSEVRLRETQEMPDIPKRSHVGDEDGKPDLGASASKKESSGSEHALDVDPSESQEDDLGDSLQHLKQEKMEDDDLEGSGDLDKAKEQDRQFAETPPLPETLNERENLKSEAHGAADITNGKLGSDSTCRTDESSNSRVTEAGDSKHKLSVNASRTNLDNDDRTSGDEKLAVKVESATSAALLVPDTDSCLNEKSANSNPSDIERNNASVDSASAASSPSTSQDSPNVSQAFQDKMNHSQDTANQYMQFQRMLDSSANNSSSISNATPAQPPKDNSVIDDSREIKEGSSKVEKDADMSAVADGERSPESSSGATSNPGEASPSPETSRAPSTSLTFQPKQETIAHHLKESTYLFIPPCRYVFHGAEVYLSSDDESDDEDDLPNDPDMSSDLHNDIDGGDFASDLVNGDSHSNNHSVANSLTDLSELLSRSPPLRANQSEDGSYDQAQPKNEHHPAMNGMGDSTFEGVSPNSIHTGDAHLQDRE